MRRPAFATLPVPLRLESLDYAQNDYWFSDLSFIMPGTELISIWRCGLCRGLATEKMNLSHFNPDS